MEPRPSTSRDFNNDAKFFSIVINNLPLSINEESVKPHVALTNDQGQKAFASDGSPFTEYFNEEKHGDLQDHLVILWRTPMERYQTFDNETVAILNSIKTYLNNEQVAASFHNGYQDEDCKFHGNHLHIVQKLPTKEQHIQHHYAYKKLKKQIKYQEVSSQKISHPQAMANYLHKRPRKFIGTNCPDIQLLFDKNLQNTDKKTPAAKPPKMTQMYQNTEELINLMNKYQTTDKTTLNKLIMDRDDKDDQDKVKYLMRNANWRQVYQRATDEVITRNDHKQYNYFEQFMQITNDRGQKMMSVEDTALFLHQWCDEQRIPYHTLLMEIYAVLNMTHPKRNTLYLQGTSNAGKTFLLTGIFPFKDLVGSHITSKEFPFQECVQRPVILINELTLSTQQECELYKNILGGEPTMVNIKNKKAELMERKPVFITSNNPIWQFVSNESVPLRNRMYIHLHLRQSNVANAFSKKGIPNFRFFQAAFKTIQEILEFFNIPPNDTITEPSTIEVIQAYSNHDLTATNLNDIFEDNMEEDDTTVLEDTDQSISILSVEPPPKRAKLQMEQQPTEPPTEQPKIQQPTSKDQETQTDQKSTKEMTTQTDKPEKVNRPVQTVHPYNEKEDNKHNKWYAPRIQRLATYSDDDDENNQQQDDSLIVQGYEEMEMPQDSQDGNNTSNMVVHLSPIRSPSPHPPETPRNSPVAGPSTSTPTNRRPTSPPATLRRRRRPHATRLRLNLFQRDTSDSDSTRDLFDQL